MISIFFTWTVKKYFVAPDFSLIYLSLIWSSNGIVIFSKSWINKCAKIVTKYSFACISRVLALSLVHGPLALSPNRSHSSWPQPSALVPNFYLLALAFNLYLPTLAPNLYISALVCNLTTSQGPEFLIYRPCFLNLYLYLRPWTTICITSLVPEFEFTLLLVVVAVVVVIAVVIISLE